jgi:L-serine deaminase
MSSEDNAPHENAGSTGTPEHADRDDLLCGTALAKETSIAGSSEKEVYDFIDTFTGAMALEHHLGMTCDPVAGFVQVPCIERCAFADVKAWTAWAVASNEIASRHRIDLDQTIDAMAQTARDMNTKYKETSEAGLAVSVTLC